MAATKNLSLSLSLLFSFLAPSLGFSALSVSSGCYHKNTTHGWLIDNRNFFLTVLSLRRSRSRCQPSWAPLRSPFWVGRRVPAPHWVVLQQKGEGALWDPFSKGISPIVEALSS